MTAYKPRSAAPCRRAGAQVAQLVEHATENRSVGGSIPPLGTISPSHLGRPELQRELAKSFSVKSATSMLLP
jgi:hypothetical protein